MENFTSMPFIHLLAIIESSPQTIIWNSREKNALLKIYTNADFLRQQNILSMTGRVTP